MKDSRHLAARSDDVAHRRSHLISAGRPALDPKANDDHSATPSLGVANFNRGDFEAGTKRLDEGSGLVDGLTDVELARRIDVAMHLGACEVNSGRYSDAARHLERGVTVSRATGQGATSISCSPGRRGRGSVWGSWEARELAEAAVESARLAARPQDLAFALAVEAWTATLADDLDRGRQAAAEVSELRRGLEASVVSATAGWMAATALADLGEPAQATGLMLEAAGGPDLVVLMPATRCLCYEVLTRAALELGRIEEAAGWSDRATAIAARVKVPLATTLAGRAQGAVALARGDPQAAAAAAAASLGSAGPARARVEAARARFVLVRALAAAGDRDAAVVELTVAADELTSCGAGRLVHQVSTELRRLGRRPRARAGEGAGRGGSGLTRRESEIARLVATGKTNREIASALYVSERTVETHLTHIFAKLGVSSRAALASAVTASRTTG